MWNKTIDADLLEECFMENLIELSDTYSVEQALWDAISSCEDLKE